MNSEEEELVPGEYPVQKRTKTDKLCICLSVPIILLSLQLLIMTINFGERFSFIHPADSNGLRCGLDNREFHPNMTDFRKLRYLTTDHTCIEKCPGKSIFWYCVSSPQSMRKAPFVLKAVYDSSSYATFGVIAIIVSILIAFPLYLLCGKLAVAFTYVSVAFGFGGGVALTVVFLYLRMWYSAAMSILAVLVYGIFTYFIKRRVHIISPLISTSVRALNKSKSVYFAPFFVLMLCSVIALLAVVGVVFSLGVGAPKITNGLQIVKHGSLSTTTFVFPLVGVWLIEFVSAWARSAVSLIVTSEYFKQRIPTFTQALAMMINFHGGTLLFGSFAVFLLENVSLFFQLIRDSLKRTKSLFVRFLCKCIMSLCFCVVQFVGEINRLSFVFTSMKGVSFWAGCKEAVKALKIDSMMSLQILLHNVFLTVRLLITFVVAMITFAYTSSLQLLIPWIPMAAIPTVTYIALSALDVTMGASTETILMCLCEDAKDQGIYAPSDLEDVMHWIREKIAEKTFEPV